MRSRCFACNVQFDAVENPPVHVPFVGDMCEECKADFDNRIDNIRKAEEDHATPETVHLAGIAPFDFDDTAFD